MYYQTLVELELLIVDNVDLVTLLIVSVHTFIIKAWRHLFRCWWVVKLVPIRGNGDVVGGHGVVCDCLILLIVLVAMPIMLCRSDTQHLVSVHERLMLGGVVNSWPASVHERLVLVSVVNSCLAS